MMAANSKVWFRMLMPSLLLLRRILPEGVSLSKVISQCGCDGCQFQGLTQDADAVFYLKFFEHPSFGQVAHEIYPSEWKVHSSEISITIMYCWYMFLMAVATDFTHVTINLVCCCLSPILISYKRSCWKISQSLKPIWLDVEMLVPLF